MSEHLNTKKHRLLSTDDDYPLSLYEELIYEESIMRCKRNLLYVIYMLSKQLEGTHYGS